MIIVPIEYKDITSKAIYFSFALTDGDGILENAKFMVWTTTPWTLPCNLALAAGPLVDYIVFGRLHYNKNVSDFKDYKQFYNECVAEVENFCKKGNIKYHIKNGTNSA